MISFAESVGKEPLPMLYRTSQILPHVAVW
jgi:hypothetical protein